MKIIPISLKQALTLVFLSPLAFTQAIAAPEMDVMGKTKVIPQKHQGHSKNLAKKQQYHGVFYGFLPCKDCEGTKTTLSLKNRNNYLLVTQPSKASAREYFEKGKYIWDAKSKTVTLTSRKDSTIRKYRITDEETLTQLSSKGTSLKTSQKNTSYLLHKRDMKRTNRAGHMH